jgi:hypothetical protein
MHACLSHVYARALPYLFIYLFNVNHGDRSWPCACASFFQTKTDRRHAYVIHSAMLFFLLQAPEWFQFIGR